MGEDVFKEDLAGMHDRLLGYVLSLGAHPSEAEDILHNAFLRALKYRDTFEPGTDFVSWMFQVTRSAFFDHCKSTKRTLRRREALSRERLIQETQKPDARLERVVDPRILLALGNMQPAHRDVFLAVVVEEKSYEEIAHENDMPVGTVMSRVYRARQHLILTLAPILTELGYADLLQSKRAKRVLGDDDE